MYSLMKKVNRLIRIVDPTNGEQPSIMVFAVTPEDKPVERELPKQWADLEFEPFLPNELPKELENAATLGELQKLCKKAGYGLDVIPVEALGSPWEDEDI